MTQDLVYWSGIIICLFLLLMWVQLRLWEWIDEQSSSSDDS